MNEAAAGLTARILAIDWSGGDDRTRSRVALMKEYLRRSAWWCTELGSEDWPFCDIAALVDPAVRADADSVRRVEAALARPEVPSVVRSSCVWALHFAALRDAGVVLPGLPDPFEPLILFYERGGAFGRDGTGFIDVDLAGVPVKTRQDHLVPDPRVRLDRETLDALDGGR